MQIKREKMETFTVLLLFPGEDTAHGAGPLRVSHQAEGGGGNRVSPFIVVSTGRKG